MTMLLFAVVVSMLLYSWSCESLKPFQSKILVSVHSNIDFHRSSSSLRVKSNQSNGNACNVCKGKEGVDCVTCKGTGIDRIGGNIFERWLVVIIIYSVH